MIEIPPHVQLYEKAMRYAFITVFDSLECGYLPRFGNGGVIKHLIGKIGEMAFYEFCKENGVKVLHTPFREDYRRLNGWDDFVIQVNDEIIYVEVKTQTIKRYPKVDVLFYNVEQYNSKKFRNIYLQNRAVVFCGVNRPLTKIALLGWIWARDIEDYPIRTDLKSPAYAIPAEDLLNFDFLFNLKNVRRW